MVKPCTRALRNVGCDGKRMQMNYDPEELIEFK